MVDQEMSDCYEAYTSIAEKSFKRRNAAILHGIALGDQGARIF